MRAIDGDALIEVINRHCYPVQHDMTSIEPGMTRIGILQAIQEQPTIEPERKRGEWIPEFNGKFTGGAYWFSCSKCKRIVPEVRNGGWNFCPNCGADMRDDDIPIEYFESGGK